MASFLLAFAAVALVSLGSRDQLLVARLAERLGRGAGLLLAAWLASIASALAMAWAGQAIASVLPGPGRTMLVALATFLAAAELAWPNREAVPAEPTRSLAAISLVLLARQLGDGARFLVFALAVATASPLLAAAGGAAGGIAATSLGWAGGEQLERRISLRAVRVSLAVLLALVSITLALGARGIVALPE